MKQPTLGHGTIRFENGQLRDDLSRFWCACGKPAIKRVVDNEPPHDFVCSKCLVQKEGKEMGIRTELEWFAKQMERTLQRNDHKGGWKECTITYLYSRLKQEVEELSELTSEDYEKLIVESTDIANFAMMIADNARSALKATESPSEATAVEGN